MSVAMTLPYEPAKDSKRADAQTHFEISDFYYQEATLLDERRFEQWIDLLAEDLHYYMPTRYCRSQNERHLEFANERQSAHFDDNKQRIKVRIQRLFTDRAWSEDPLSRTRHLITNVRVKELPEKGSYEVESAFMIYRGRVSDSVEIYAGARHDLIRTSSDNDAGFEIAKRIIILDQTTILGNNLGIFF